MATYRVSYVFITLLFHFTHAQQDPYASQPKLFAEDGNLKLQAGRDKNIIFVTSGSGGVYLNEENLVTLSRLARSASESVNGFKLSVLPLLQNDVYRLIQSVEGKDGVIKRLMKLELSNISAVASPTGGPKLNKRVQALDRQIRKLEADMRRNECASNPCRNGGTCIDLFAKYQCICPENWEGVSCENDVNECVKFASTEDGCQNGGTCINTPGGFHCVCSPHYFGIHCAAKNFSCSAASNRELCGHGTCREHAGSYVCVCDEGWTQGERGSCDKDIDECASKVPVCSLAPPVHCINTPGSFQCGACPAGFTGNGLYCVDIDECIVNNGGCSRTPYVECTNTLGYRRCGSCPPGWVGDDGTYCRKGVTGCSINNGGCHPLASCSLVSDNLMSRIDCTCPPGMGGSGVGLLGCAYGQSGDPCIRSPCGLGGTCLRKGSGEYVCICQPGKTGQNCEQSLTPSGVSCDPNPCQNGGLCHVTPLLGISCMCRDGYTGAWCTEQTMSCGGTIVQLNGTIRNSANTYSIGTTSCVWTLDLGDEGSILKLNFSSNFRVYSERGDCMDNHLEIRDGDLPYDSSSVLGRFCSPSSTPSSLTSLSSKVIVSYLVTIRDPLGPLDQWELSWTSASPECGSLLANISGPGVLSSPGFPRSITKSVDCLWYLSTNPGYRLEFTVTEISFGNQQYSAGETCDQDFLKIHDGEMAYSPILLEVCQGSRNLPSITTSGTHSLIWYSSNAASKNKGFQIMYRPILGIPGCGGTYTSPEGDIHTKYLAELNQDLLCEWNIHLSVQEKIRLVFQRMDIDSPNCDSYLEVYNGHSKSLVAKFCDGASSRVPLLSDGNTVRLVYKVKYQPSKPKPGFSLHYETVCGGELTTPQGILKSPFFPRAYPSSRVCRYTIIQPPGKLIKLDFIDFDLSEPEPKDRTCVESSVKIFNGDSRNHSLLGEYCGSKEPPTIVSTRNILYLEFKTDGSSEHIGFRANYSTLDVECGGIFTASAGSISLDTSLRSTKSCEWILSAPEGNMFHLTFVQFNIQSGVSSFFRIGNQQCSLTGVSVYDNVTNPGILMNKLCGSSLPSPMTSLSNLVTLSLSLSKYSLQANPVASFVLNYVRVNASTMCGGNYFAPSGAISSPLFPSPYPPTSQCVWVITAPMGQQIRLNFTSFSLEPSNLPSCMHVDYLEIRDGGYESSPLRGKHCGTDYPREFISSGHQLYLKFVSDEDKNKWPGFRLLWDSASTACGGILTAPSGSITSPNYPYPYGYSGMCYWKIHVSQGSALMINFVDVNINCLSIFSGNLEVFDGDNSFAPQLGRYCRGGSKWESIIHTTSNVVLVRYHSINSDDKGFHLQYQTACNRTFTGYRGAIETINYPGNYPSRTECWWNITVPMGNQISLAFSDFTLEKRTRTFLIRNSWYNSRFARPIPVQFDAFRAQFLPSATSDISMPGRCFDYLEMFETHAEDESFQAVYESFAYRKANRGNSLYPLLNKTCGQEKPPAVLTTNGSAVYIHFVTDFGMNAKGFRLEWSLKGCGGIFEGRSYGRITSPHYGEHGAGKYYKHDLICDWVIRGNLDQSVEITITTVDLETRSECNLDHLIVYSGSNNEGVNLTQPLCMTPRSPIVVTAPNEAFVHFESDISLSGRGFELTFRLKPAVCGGIFTGSNGVIHTRNYPKNYEQGDKCVYQIKVPEGHLIQLTFEDFDLGICWPKTISMVGTSVEVHNGDSVSAPLLTTLCGNQLSANTSTVTSSSNKLTVLFQAGAHATPRKGFKASYKMACGARIETDGSGNFKVSLSDLIASKLTKCSWTIVAKKPESRITLTVPTTKGFQIYSRDQFNIYGDTPTNEFFVYDGETDKGILLVERPLDRIPHSIISRGPTMHVVLMFSENYLDSLLDEVFFASYSVRNIACGGELSGDEGSFSSPNYPLQYPTNADCVWTVKSSPGNKIAIQFTDFQLEQSDFCNEDFVELRESNVQGKLLGVYCGNQLPGNVTVNSNFWIRFKSSSTGVAQGFTADFSYVSNIEILNENRGVITSPQYPALYTYVKKFSWYIRVNQESRVRIKMLDFWFESGGQGCNTYGNSLNIYEGNLPDETKLLHSDLCTASINTPIISLTNEVLLQFDSNPSRRGSHFKLEWETIAGVDTNSTDVKNSSSWNPFPYLQNATLSSYSLTLDNSSLNISHQYHEKPEFMSLMKAELMTAVNRIIAPVGYRVTIQVTANSELNRVQVYGGSSDPSRQGDLIKLTELVPATPLSNILLTPMSTNSSKSAVITSSNNVLYLVIETSSTNMFFNWYSKLDTTTNATVTLSCGGIITGLTSGTIQMNKLIGTRTRFPRIKVGYKEILTCDWVIAVRSRRTIQIQMTGSDFNPKTGSEKDCNDDNYIMIRNGGSNISPKLGQDEKFCSSITPDNERKQPKLTSSGNLVFVRYKANINAIQSFSLSFTELSIGCGGDITIQESPLGSTWALLSSPHYPEVPPPHIECTWTIRGPVHRKLRLTFDSDNFDLAYSTGCTTEYVEVLDGQTLVSPALGKYCAVSPSVLESSGNTLLVKYFTDIDEPKSGFSVNVSLQTCGGVYKDISSLYTLSISYRDLIKSQSCEWTLQTRPSQTLSLNLTKFDVNEPYSVWHMNKMTNCTEEFGRLSIYTVEPFSKNQSLIYSECSSGTVPFFLETGVHQIIVQFKWGNKTPDRSIIGIPITRDLPNRGFSLILKTEMTSCGGTLTARTGILSLPSLAKSQHRYCLWNIRVPKGQRIKVKPSEVDFAGKQPGYVWSIGDVYLYNNAIYFGYPYKVSQATRPFAILSKSDVKPIESTDNKLDVYTVSVTGKGIKLEYTSEDPALCGGTLNSSSGSIKSPVKLNSFYCEWTLNTPPYYTTALTINGTVSKGSNAYFGCNAALPPLENSLVAYNHQDQVIHRFCASYVQPTLFLNPYSTLNLLALKGHLNGNNELLSPPMDFNISYTTYSCGGVFKSPSNITLPPSTNSTGELHCVWLVEYPAGDEIKISFPSLPCNEDASVSIYNGPRPSSPLLNKHKTCQNPVQITSTSNILWIEYHVTSPGTDLRFSLDLEKVSLACGDILSNPTGVVTSPGYTDQGYPDNTECQWYIHGLASFYISLQFESKFFIQDSVNCTADYLLIYDWFGDDYVLMDRICGRLASGRTYNSTRNRMKLVFRSDAGVNGDGFKFHYRAKCGGTYTLPILGHDTDMAGPIEGTINSPNYPANYPPMIKCNYTFIDESRLIRLNFTDFQTEQGPDCEFDNLTLISANPENYHNSVMFGGSFLSIDGMRPPDSINSKRKVYCGEAGPGVQTFTDRVSVIFQSDPFKAGRGFVFQYQLFKCGGEVTTEGTISTPGYKTDMICVWNITAPPNKMIVLTILSYKTSPYAFHWLEDDDETSCKYGVFITDPGNPTRNISQQNKTLCDSVGDINEQNPVIFRSTGRSSYLKLHNSHLPSDEGLSVLKFNVRFNYDLTKGCGGTRYIAGNSSLHITQLKDAPDPYFCSWDLTTLPGYTLKISFPLINIFSPVCGGTGADSLDEMKAIVNSQCLCNRLEVVMIDSPPTILCMSNQSIPLLSIDHSVTTVKFVQNSYFPGLSFDILVESILPECGDRIINATSTGRVFVSPPYRRNLNCQWKILVEGSGAHSKVVQIKFLDMDIEPGTGDQCEENYLQLRNPGDSIVGKYCGRTQPPVSYLLVDNNKNKPNIVFRTGDKMPSPRRGFKFEYQVIGCSRNYSEDQHLGNLVTMIPPPGGECRIHVNAPNKNQTLDLVFLEFRLSSENCNTDKLVLKDAEGGALATLCGTALPPPLFTSTHSISAHLYSSRTTPPFRVSFTYLTSKCGVVLTDSRGALASRDYPLPYRDARTCVYTITSPQPIKITFVTFDLGNAKCASNYLRVDVAGKNNIKYCAGEKPADIDVTTSVVLTYTTSTNNEGQGWLLTYTPIPDS